MSVDKALLSRRYQHDLKSGKRPPILPQNAVYSKKLQRCRTMACSGKSCGAHGHGVAQMPVAAKGWRKRDLSLEPKCGRIWFLLHSPAASWPENAI